MTVGVFKIFVLTGVNYYTRTFTLTDTQQPYTFNYYTFFINMAYNYKKFSVKDQKTGGAKKISNETPGTSKMPALMTRLVSTDAPGAQNSPPIALADRDLRLGRATWNKYVLPAQDFGCVLFKELFQTYPDYEQFFMAMVKGNNRDIFISPQFKLHMTSRVTNKLKDIMENLDKPEELHDIMTKLGLYHAKLGVTRKHMEGMQRSIVNAVRVVMNKTMQFDEEDALNKCLTYALRIAINTAEEYYENQKQIATS